MQKMERLSSLEVITMLDKLNTARQLYEKATNEATRQKADKMFADCYDWFIQRDIMINYEPAMRLWFLQR